MGNIISRKVKVSNSASDPLFVTLESAGNVINAYNEILSLAGLATTTVLTYTVPVGKLLRLKRVDFSGGNRSIFTLEINSSVESKKRMYFTKYNDAFEMEDLDLVAGDVIDVIVENKTNMIADFNANLVGSLLDA